MTNKSDVKEREQADAREAAASEEGTGPVVLRDESDEIIDNLKQQLDSLQGQLARYRAGETGGSGGGPPRPGTLAAWNADVVRHLASGLQGPAGELTRRLERLIDQVSDPALREELERCRDTASFLFDTFRRISDNHHLLTASLSLERPLVDRDALLRELGEATRAGGRELPVRPRTTLPERVKVAAPSAAGALRILTQAVLAMPAVADDGALCVEVAVTPGQGGRRPALWVCLRGEVDWPEQSPNAPVASLAFKPGRGAAAVVDLLYVEKIVALGGGRLSFHQRDGKVRGVELALPAERLDDADTAPTQSDSTA